MIPHCMSNDEPSNALLDFHSYLQRCPSRLPAGNNPPLIHYLTGIQTQHAPYPLVLSAKTTKEHCFTTQVGFYPLCYAGVRVMRTAGTISNSLGQRRLTCFEYRLADMHPHDARWYTRLFTTCC